MKGGTDLYIKQDIPSKSMSFIVLILGIFLGVFAVDFLFSISVYLPSYLQLPLTVGIVFCLLFLVFEFVFYQLAHYHYQYVDNLLVFERAIGRTNHAVITVRSGEILQFVTFTTQKVKRRDFFTHRKKGDELYFIEFSGSYGVRGIVIEPDKDFVMLIKKLSDMDNV